MSPRPRHVRLRVYNVGFGDCMLLTVTYGAKFGDGRNERHMLIDCGSREKVDGGPNTTTIAKQIAKHTNGHLDVVVATHRHQDHIGGFGVAAVRKTLDDLNPRLVIRPWTDIPYTDDDPKLDDNSKQLIKHLVDAATQLENISALSFDSDNLKRRAEQLAGLGFKNRDAIALLEQWATNGRALYVKADERHEPPEMPGVTIEILGPPTLKQVPHLTRYAASSDDYWLQRFEANEIASALAEPTPPTTTATLATLAAPYGAGAAGWLVRQLREQRLTQSLDIIEGFDDVLNNTSVIMLVTVGSRSILFAGDAQLENWTHVLNILEPQPDADGTVPQAKINAAKRLNTKLSNIDVYKVGHHGSRNATPKRLAALWVHRKSGAEPLISVLTTKCGVYDKSIEGEVPKPELVRGLKRLGDLHRTDRLQPDQWWFDLTAGIRRTDRFTHTPGPPQK